MATKAKSFDLDLGDRAVIDPLRTAGRNVQHALGNYLGVVAVQKWGYPEGQELSFDLSEVEDNKITVTKAETK